MSIARERWRCRGDGVDVDGHVLDCLAWADDTWLFACTLTSLDGMIGVLRQVAWEEAGLELRFEQCTWVATSRAD